MVGLAVMLALTVGVAGAALAANGGSFILGQNNVATAITKLAGSAGVPGPSLRIDNNSADVAATALDLQVEAGKPPMTVNSDAKVANLNADKLDGKGADELGVNGLITAANTGVSNSDSPKSITVTCPAGKVAVGTGFAINGGSTGAEADVVMDDVFVSSPTQVTVSAFEEEPTSATWSVTAQANCATAP
jgi:hypothetical protein